MGLTAFFLLAAAFPGAEGAGANAQGGRGGDVYHVTNLRDSGDGSLRQGIASARGPRTIVFDVAGTIRLASPLSINRPFLTLAGQTAPGGGVTVAGFTTRVIDTHDVIVRYMRFRAGDLNCPAMQDDALQVDRSSGVILDHVSASWSVDETLSVTESSNVTVQWSIVSESLENSCHEKGAHGYGTLLRYGAGTVTMHHNLWAHHRSRNPRLGDNLLLDFVNNVIYGHGGEAGYSGENDESTPRMNYLGNYVVAGPATSASRRTRAFTGGGVNTRIFASGNRVDSNINGRLDGADTGWAMFAGEYTRADTRFSVAAPITLEPADDAYRSVLGSAGASLARDAVDARIVREVIANQGKIIDSQRDVGGWPELAAGTALADSDGDGMPDAWERARGLDPANPADGAVTAANGYTNLELYLDALTRPAAAANATLVEDVFADGESQTHDLRSGSLRWFNGRATTARADAPGSVTFDLTGTGASSDAFWAYFTDDAPVELGVGDRLSVSVTFRLDGFRANGQDIRWGILDSKRSRNSANLGGGQNDTSFIGDTGYGVQFYASGAGSPFVLGRRANLTLGNPFNNFGDFATIPGAGASSRQALANGTDYTLTQTLERMDERRIRASVTVTGGTLDGLAYSGIDDAVEGDPAFDYFTFRIGGTNFTEAVRFTRASVEYVPAPPVITAQPQPSRLAVQVGGAVTLVASASGRGVNTVWFKDGVSTGREGVVLSLPRVAMADAGVYTLVASNAGGSATSDPVLLTVSADPVPPPPAIAAPPASLTVVRGLPVTLAVDARGPGLVYQWFFNGAPIVGAVAASYRIAEARAADSGSYTVLVSNTSGSIMSAAGRLLVVSPMAITSVSPHPGVDGLCTDTPLSIAFNLPPRIGRAGRIVVTNERGEPVDAIAAGAASDTRLVGGQPFRYRPLRIEDRTVSVYLQAPLPPSGRYFVNVEEGAFEDETGAPYVGLTEAGVWGIGTRALPSPGAAELSVAANGAGDFCTVQGAVDHVPAGNTRPVTITVQPGTYREIVYVPSSKPFITVRGVDRERTLIAHENNNNLNPSTVGRALFGVDAADFRLENLTIVNTTPKGGSQAEAFRSNAARVRLDRVTLRSFQDTLLLNGSAFVTGSYIEGDVDFIWGSAAAYFRDCEIRSVSSGAYYTQSRTPQGQNGFVFVDSRLTGAPDTSGAYLSRLDPGVFPFGQVVFLGTAMGPHLRREGWLLDNAVTSSTVRFWESGTTDLEGRPLDVSGRASFSRQLTPAEAAQWRDPVFVLGGWDPR